MHETMDADVIQLRRIARVAGLATRVDGQAIVDDLRDRLHEECDYAHEAAWQARFAGWFRDDPAVVVPAVVSDRSSGTVLTTHWCDGRPLEDFLSAPKEARDAAGLVLARFAWRSMFVHGAIHADPHPGNQLYRDDGTVVFLDFGCIRVFEPAWLDAVRAEIRALLMGDRRAFRDAVVAQGMAPRPDRFDFDGHWAMQRHMWSPYLEPGYTFGPAWVEEGMRFSGPNAPNAFELAVPPPWIWMIRLQWGLHAVLARLGATGPFDAVLRDALGDG